MDKLDGRVAVITGAGRGQGLAAAHLFAAEGARVVVNDLDEQSVEHAVAAIRAAGGEAAAAVADVSDPAQVERMLGVARSAFGGLDVVYNNAGIGHSAGRRFGIRMDDVVSATIEDFRRIVEINLGGVFFSCKYAIPMLIERGGGVIVNTANLSALRGGSRAHAYASSKGAVVALTRSIAVTYGPDGIRANAICPGLIDTDMVHDLMIADDEIREAFVGATPLRRYGTVDDVARTALFLASDDSGFISGETIAVDGGYIA